MNRHTIVLVTSLTLVAVLGVFGAARLAATGPEGPSSLAPAAQEATATESPSGTETPTEVSIEDLRVTQYEVFISRDPFEPVIVSVSDGDDGDTPTTSPTVNPTVSPTTSPTASPSPTVPDDGCVDTGTVVCGGDVVKLVDVFDDGQPGAVVQVDQTVYEVRVNETFAGSYQVRSIEAACATLLYGDDAFTLCEGESTLK